MSTPLYYITGASGSGKTTLLKLVAKKHLPNLCHYHNDDLGVPSHQEMIEKFGSGEAWQAHQARLWCERALQLRSSEVVVVDSQAKPTDIFAAARETGLTDVKVVLIDCHHGERKRRLIEDRNQPELDHLDMYAWAAYLAGQADALNLETIDTTEADVDDCAENLAGSIRKFFRDDH